MSQPTDYPTARNQAQPSDLGRPQIQLTSVEGAARRTAGALPLARDSGTRTSRIAGRSGGVLAGENTSCRASSNVTTLHEALPRP
jgi:hypothetical protein